jgi:glyoxylase-like metal-dependent hydrolase (beta-lactamase superfamily II)
MLRLIASAIATVALAISFSVAGAQSAAKLSLARMDCGSGVSEPLDVRRFSDTYAFETLKLSLTVSCYLIRHGDDVMIWDTGYPAAAPGTTPAGPSARVSLVEHLAKVSVEPSQVKYVGISHYHADHTGQAGSFPDATLLIGKGDWDVLVANSAPEMANPAPVQHWIGGGGKVEAVTSDKDVFGDGSVVMLSTPGHTPGHNALLVRLQEKGAVLLTGDLAHLQENYETNGVPTFNTNRADTLASLDRFKRIARNLNATVIIQHDPRYLDRLPTFPEAAK